jgi:hypothetical protein
MTMISGTIASDPYIITLFVLLIVLISWWFLIPFAVLTIVLAIADAA